MSRPGYLAISEKAKGSGSLPAFYEPCAMTLCPVSDLPYVAWTR